MKIKDCLTEWRYPADDRVVYKIRYYLARYEGNMKNGKKIWTNVYEPIVITQQEKKLYGNVAELANLKTKLAKKAFTKRIKENLSGTKRIGMPSVKGRFYFLNAKEVL